MIPETVEFSGLSVNPQSILRSRKTLHAWPASWTRYSFTVDAFGDYLRRLDQWLTENTVYRWGSYSYSHSLYSQTCYVVGFESVSDAVMFRLKDGESAFLEDKIV